MTSCGIEDDTDFIHWTFQTDNSMTSDNRHTETGSQNSTVELKGLKNFGKDLKPEPSLPDLRDLRGRYIKSPW